jgi:two-component system sensor histidine kinase AlgZ
MQLFVAIVMIQILVIIYSMSFLSFDFIFLQKLSTLSLLSQFIGLIVLVVLCKFRSFFNSIQVVPGVLLLLFIVIAITFVIANIIAWLDFRLFSFVLLNEEVNNYLVIKLSVAAVVVTLALVRYFYIQDQWKLQVQNLSDTRLRALQSRIKPHFLFNTLNSIASLVSIDSQKAEQAIVDLSSLMRRTFTEQNKEVSISDELNFVKQFLSIEKLRLGDRLDFDIDCEKELLHNKIPVLSIQPLVENAIIHGIQPLEKGGKIEVKIFAEDKMIIIKVRNPYLLGFNKTVNGMALKNIEERLKLLYGNSSFMKIVSEDQIFDIQLSIPL